MNELEERMNELEIRFAHQARYLEELNELALDYGRRLDRLERETRRLELLVGSAPPAEKGGRE